MPAENRNQAGHYANHECSKAYKVFSRKEQGQFKKCDQRYDFFNDADVGIVNVNSPGNNRRNVRFTFKSQRNILIT